MSDRLTDDELDRLEELHSGGPKGPMRWGEDLLTGNPSDGPDAITVRSADGCSWAALAYDPDGANLADLFASAHNALPALLAEVREHRARQARYAAALDALVDGDDR